MSGGITKSCSSCAVRNQCLGLGIDNEHIHFLDTIPKKRIQARTGDVLYQQGDAFFALYAIVHGTAKAVIKFSQNDISRVVSLVLRGDLIGHTAVTYGEMTETLIATEPSVICVIPYRAFTLEADKHPVLWQQFVKATMRATRQRYLMRELSSRGDGEKRVLSFLRWLAGELEARGQYASGFMLPMSKSDLANLLDMNHATLSRIFSTLARKGRISVQGPYISMMDEPKNQLSPISLQDTVEDVRNPTT
jgi:CRP/FNR family transcriptional regulator, anaerobic regulatory protein